MKLRYIAFLAIFFCGLAYAQTSDKHLQERTLLTTDRPWYAAGESIKCSAFCLASEGTFSNFSSIAYIEVYGASGTVASGKIALTQGRGGGSIDIPSDIPTGNYRIVAYTSTNKNEEGYDYEAVSKVITIYNTSSTARVKDGVKVSASVAEATAVPANIGQIKTTVGAVEDGFIPINISAPDGATLSISLWKDEGFARYDNSTLGSLGQQAWKQPTTKKYAVYEDYDGEVIYASITGTPDTTTLFLASPGSRYDIYKAHPVKDGRMAFFTDNIYGNKDIAIISLSGKDTPFEASFESPFVGIEAGDIPALELAPSMKEGLYNLDASLRISKAFDADTLYSALKVRKMDLLGSWRNKYNMDDYTRFVTMREVFIEFLHDIHIENDKGAITMKVKTLDVKGNPSFRHLMNSLILLDGVPVTDHKIVYEMDPMLIKCVEIYPRNYAFGSTYFCGAANFVTYTGNLSGAQLGKSSRILSFKGASIPMVYSASKAAYDPDFPAISETVFWHPLATIPAGETYDIDVVVPALPGTYYLTVEGFSASGEAIFYQREIAGQGRQ